MLDSTTPPLITVRANRTIGSDQSTALLGDQRRARGMSVFERQAGQPAKPNQGSRAPAFRTTGESGTSRTRFGQDRRRRDRSQNPAAARVLPSASSEGAAREDKGSRKRRMPSHVVSRRRRFRSSPEW